MKSIPLADIPMFYEEAGAGEVLLLVHGFPLDHTMWQAQLAGLQDDFRVIAPDLRGFGRTPLSAEGVETAESVTTMRQFADDLAALLDRLAIDEPVNFCGLSMGGYVGWQFALHYRHRLKRLVQCDTKALADTEEARANRLKVARKALEEGSEFLAEAMSLKLISDGTTLNHPEVSARIRQMIAATPPHGIAAAQRGMAERPDVTEQLAQIDTPTLLLGGSDDTISPPSEMQNIAERMPNARFVEIADAGHMTPMEKPNEVNEVIRAFL